MRENVKTPPRFSLVVPFHDEQQSVRELHRQLSEIMTGRFEPVEFVYVDDQSSDATPQILAEIAEDADHVMGLPLQAGEILGGGPRAFQKYEAGDLLPSQAIGGLLAVLDSDPGALSVLRSRKSGVKRQTAAA